MSERSCLQCCLAKIRTTVAATKRNQSARFLLGWLDDCFVLTGKRPQNLNPLLLAVSPPQWVGFFPLLFADRNFGVNNCLDTEHTQSGITLACLGLPQKINNLNMAAPQTRQEGSKSVHTAFYIETTSSPTTLDVSETGNVWLEFVYVIEVPGTQWKALGWQVCRTKLPPKHF